MIETLLVGAIVLVATLYATWALLPTAGRQRVARRLARLSAASGVPAWLQRGARTLERRTSSTSGHCDGCSAQPPRDEPNT
jgi:hypothetical protein